MSPDLSLIPNHLELFDPSTWEVGREITVSTDIVAAGIALFSLVIAVYTYVRTTRTNRRQAIRQHTIDVLSIINQDGPVMRSQLVIADWNRKKKEIPDDRLSVEEDRVVIAALDYYDFVSAMALKGELDLETIVVLLGGRMVQTVDRLKNYIDHRRVTLNRKGLYKPLLEFVETHVRPLEGRV